MASGRIASATASPYLGLVLVTIVWGCLHPLAKLAMHEVSPIQLVLGRVGFACLTLSLFLLVQGKAGAVVDEFRTRPGTIIALGLVSFFASSGSSMIALSFLPASVSSLLSNVSPLFVAIGVIGLQRGRTSLGAIVGICVGFLGLGLIIFGEDPAGFGNLTLNPFGVALSLFGSLTWAIYIGLSRRASRGGSPIAIVTASSICGAIPWLVISIVTGDFARLAEVPPSYLALLVFLGAIATGLTYTLWNTALARLNAANVAVFQYAIPFWAVVISIVLLGERVTVPLVIGAFCIVAGIAITQREGRKPHSSRVTVKPPDLQPTDPVAVE
jgi:drug/metabolite transporter (DMT)-like permease